MNPFDFIPAAIEQIQKDVGFSTQTGFFETAVNESLRIIAEKNPRVDLYYSDSAALEVRKQVQWLRQSPDNGIRFQYYPDDSFRVMAFPVFIAAVGILLLDEDYTDKKYLENWLRCKKDQYRALWVVDYTEQPGLERVIRSGTRRIEKFHYQKAGTLLTAEDIREWLGEEEMATCLKLGIAQTLEPLFELMKEIVARENNILQTRKLANTFDSQIIRKEETQNNSVEIINFTKQLLQKNLGELEKSFRLKYEDLNKPNIGFFAMSTSSFASQISALEYEELAEKSEKFQTTLPEEITAGFLKENEEMLTKELNKDRAYAETILNDVIKKINQLLQEKTRLTIPADFSGFQLVSNERILKSNNYIQRAYQGETTKKGAMEYFVALRDYTGLMMVVVGLLAPLNMIASASDGTFGGPFAKFLKSIATWVKLGTALITATMIVYGIHDLRKRIPRKRKEETDREVSKAKDSIIQEGKRIYADASRDWVQNITSWLKDVANQVTIEVEKLLKSVAEKKVAQLSSEKNNQTRSQQSIDNALRYIQNAERSLGTAAGKFNEIKQSLKFSKP